MKKGQIWIETVLYTLIGLSLIALVLSYVTPKINEMKDRALVEQSIEAMNALNAKMGEIENSPGSVRIIEFTLKKGKISVNSEIEQVELSLSGLQVKFSEPGIEIDVGKARVLTEQKQDGYGVSIKIDSNMNITYNGSDNLKEINQASVPYKISIANKGIKNGKYNIDLKIV